MESKLKILYVTMDPLETNTSANIRNRGLLSGLAKLGHVVDTLSLETDINSIGYDATVSVSGLVRERYFFKANMLYKQLRTKKGANTSDKGQASGKKKSSIMAVKTALVKLIKFVLNNISAYDLQRFNAKNVLDTDIELEQYDIILSSSDPKSAHLVAKNLRKKYKKNIWVQYWGDPFAKDITGKQSAWSSFLRKQAEAELLKNADKVIYTSPFTLEMQKSLYPKWQEKMSYAVQVADAQDTSIKEKDCLEIGYFGDYNSKVRNIRPLFDAVAGKEEQLIVCGNGDVTSDSSNIVLNGRVEYSKVVKLESKADILACICNRTGTQIPGKIYYVAGYQKPIILILDGDKSFEMRQFFEQFDRYILCENSKESIETAIAKAKQEISSGKIYQIPREMMPEHIAETVLKGVRGKG